jgi:DNA-binding CsgD family transcriptional regulator
MFCDRLEAADPTFRLTRDNVSTIADLCAELDGQPLALEIAALPCTTLSVTRVLELFRQMGPTALRERTSDMARSPRSLESAMEVSWRGLPDDSKMALRQLSVFSGPFTWEAAASVVVSPSGATADGTGHETFLSHAIDVLMDSGLVRRKSHFEQPELDRFIVPGPLRRFAGERASRSEIAGARLRHVAFFRAVARQAADTLWTFSSTPRNDLVADAQDLLMAFDFTSAHESAARALAFAIDLEPLWLALGGELGATQTEIRLAAVRSEHGTIVPGTDLGLVAQALVTLVVLRLWSRYPNLGSPASDLVNEATELALTARRPDIARRAMEAHVQLMLAEGRHGEARRFAEQGAASAREAGDAFGEMRFENWLAVAENNSGNPIAALEHAIVARDIARASGDEYHLLTTSHVMAGIPGASDDARAMPPTSEELLALARRLGADRFEGMVLIAAALKSAIIGRAETSASYVLDALDLAHSTGAWHLEALALFVLVPLANISHQARRAAELHGALHDAMPLIRNGLPAAAVAWYDACIPALQQTLGRSEFDHQIARGREWTWTDAVAFGEELALAVDTTSAHGDPRSEARPLASQDTPAAGIPRLSSRELQALELISTGASNKEIATRLRLRPKTVMHYTSSLYRKLGVRSRAEAVSVGWNSGLLRTDAGSPGVS